MKLLWQGAMIYLMVFAEWVVVTSKIVALLFGLSVRVTTN